METQKKSDRTDTPGERLKAARKHAGITQQELADRVHIVKNHVSLIERGGRRLTEEMAAKSAEVLGVRSSWLLCQDEYMTEADAFDAAVDRWAESNRAAARALVATRDPFMQYAIQKAGFTMEPRDYWIDPEDGAVMGEKPECAGEWLAEGTRYYFISESGSEAYLSDREYRELWSNILDYAVYYIQRTIKLEREIAERAAKLGREKWKVKRSRITVAD